MIASLITDYERAVINRLRQGNECTRIAVGEILELPMTAAGWRCTRRSGQRKARKNPGRINRYEVEGYRDEPREYGKGKVRTITLKRTRSPGG